MVDLVKSHYERYPYPGFPLLASVKRSDTYAINLQALWVRFNGCLPPRGANRILLAGCGTFSPYPWSLANPDAFITALDLSEPALKRAGWHCRLHGRFNVKYKCGSLLDENTDEGSYALIDCFGVLHHLPSPQDGLSHLERLLAPGGIMRIMLYSRYARKEEESIRRAFRLLGVNTHEAAKGILKRAVSGSRLAAYLDASDEPATSSGLADALLHPCVHTYRIDEVLEMLDKCGLEIALFAHGGALESVADEVERLKVLEQKRQSPGNFVFYAVRKRLPEVKTGITECKVFLNPCIKNTVGLFKLGSQLINNRIGCVNPVLTFAERRFLRRFTNPVHVSELSIEDADRVAVYKRVLFLLECR